MDLNEKIAARRRELLAEEHTCEVARRQNEDARREKAKRSAEASSKLLGETETKVDEEARRRLKHAGPQTQGPLPAFFDNAVDIRVEQLLTVAAKWKAVRGAVIIAISGVMLWGAAPAVDCVHYFEPVPPQPLMPN